MDTASKTWQHSVAKVLSKKQGGERTMTAKTARVYTLDELKEKCQGALVDPKLVEIVKTAPQNKNGKVNLTWVYKEAEKYVHEQTKDLQKTKELAVAARFLAMLRRDFAEEFEKLIAQEKQLKSTTEEENFFKKKFKLPRHITTTTRTTRTVSGDFSEVFIQFTEEAYYRGENAMYFCLKILNAMLEDENLMGPDLRRELRGTLIQLLEEKFGLKVKICGNCRWFVPDNKQCNHGSCFTYVPDGYAGKLVYYGDTCEKIAGDRANEWTPKEVSEKPSSA